MSKIKITRLKEWANRKFNYQILVNGEEKMVIASGEEKELSISVPATIQAKIMWGGSPKLKIDPAKLSTGKLNVGANKWIHYGLIFGSITILSISTLFSSLYPTLEMKKFLTGLLIGLIISLIYLVTLGKNAFLRIKVTDD